MVRTKARAPVLFLRARGLGVKISSTGGPESAYDGFVWSFSPGLSLDATDSGEVINSLSFTRRTYTICIMTRVKWGCRS